MKRNMFVLAFIGLIVAACDRADHADSAHPNGFTVNNAGAHQSGTD